VWKQESAGYTQHNVATKHQHKRTEINRHRRQNWKCPYALKRYGQPHCNWDTAHEQCLPSMYIRLFSRWQPVSAHALFKGALETQTRSHCVDYIHPFRNCGLGAGSIHFRAIVNNKQCQMMGLFMSLVIHYWIGNVQDCQGVSASEMTCIVSSGALNSTHSL